MKYDNTVPNYPRYHHTKSSTFKKGLLQNIFFCTLFVIGIPDISRVDENFNAFCIFTPVQSVNHYFFQFHTNFKEN